MLSAETIKWTSLCVESDCVGSTEINQLRRKRSFYGNLNHDNDARRSPLRFPVNYVSASWKMSWKYFAVAARALAAKLPFRVLNSHLHEI